MAFFSQELWHSVHEWPFLFFSKTEIQSSLLPSTSAFVYRGRRSISLTTSCLLALALKLVAVPLAAHDPGALQLYTVASDK